MFALKPDSMDEYGVAMFFSSGFSAFCLKKDHILMAVFSYIVGRNNRFAEMPMKRATMMIRPDRLDVTCRIRF
jgi:hypothetical protein